MDPDKQSLKKWREDNRYKILEQNRKVLEKIRDSKGAKEVTCPTCGNIFNIPWAAAKEIIESAKTLARQAGVLAPDKVVAPKEKDSLQHVAVDELSESDVENIEGLIHDAQSWDKEKDEG